MPFLELLIVVFIVGFACGFEPESWSLLYATAPAVRKEKEPTLGSSDISALHEFWAANSLA